MSGLSPNCFVIFGSESALVQSFVNSIDETSQVIRIYNKQIPKPKQNCVDISSIDKINDAINKLNPLNITRIAFIGVVSRTQNSLFLADTLKNVKDTLDVNIVSYVELIHRLLPYMVRNKYGRLVYLSSFRSEHRGRGSSVYSASKSFCESFFSSIGKEFGGLNIVSSSIRMGYFEGGMSDSISKKIMDQYLKKVALRRKGSASELSNAIWFALLNPYTNGGVIDLDGGIAFD